MFLLSGCSVDRAESLEIVSSVPSSVQTDEPLPDFEVRIMTSTELYRDSNGNPIKFPILHGFDTNLDIQATVTWDQKVFAGAPPANMSIDGMDLSPIFSSNIELTQPSANMTYMDDIAVRKRAILLPGGYYGAVFDNMALRDVSPGVLLNFTMSYPGGEQYYEDVTIYGSTPPTPYSRAGIAWPELPHLLTGKQATFWPVIGNVPPTDIVLGDTITTQIYEGIQSQVLWARDQPVNQTMCEGVSDAGRKAWCLQSGYTLIVAGDHSPGMTLTNPIAVVGKH